MTNFITVHMLHALPLNNVNRDQNGLPKSAMDGGVQRARISSQALKRAARVAFRDSDPVGSVRTRVAHDEIVSMARAYAQSKDLPFDEASATKVAKAAIRTFSHAKAADEKDESKEADGKDTILFWSQAELETMARVIVEGQSDPKAVAAEAVGDVTSPSLDVAAFGRMFAGSPTKGTQAAVAVSPAVGTHQMSLTIDYFTAVEEAAQSHGGAAHIDMAYFTSGVYYRTFTIDVRQLARSWSGFDGETSDEQLAALVKALVTAIPSGRSTNSAPNTLPLVVLAEAQRSRVAYGFDTPVQPAGDGGYSSGSVKALVDQVAQARAFDPANFGEAAYVDVAGLVGDEGFAGATEVEGIDALIEFVLGEVRQGS